MKDIMFKPVIMVMLIFSATLYAQFGGGNGTEESPWVIDTADHLNNLRNFIGEEYTNAFFEQRTHINLNVPPYNQGRGWTPIAPNTFTPFMGNYNGNGFVINGLTMTPATQTSYLSFFGFVENATIKNVSFENVNMSNGGYQSAVVASRMLRSTVTNCNVTGRVRGTANNRIAGFVAVNQTAQIIDCWTDIDFATDGSWCGGFAGVIISQGIIRNCYSSGSFVSMNVESQNLAGLVGMNAGGFIYDSYSVMSISAENGAVNIGGLVGNNTGSVVNCYAAGRMRVGETDTGGLIGINTGTVETSYWDMEATGLQHSAAGLGRHTRQMVYPYDQTTYIDWDFEEVWEHDSEERINNGYPILHYQHIIHLEIPEVTINYVLINDQKYIRLNWEPVENANSYRIFVSDNPYTENWGEPQAVTGETNYTEIRPMTQERIKFYRVTASTDNAP